jgi:hypothetical protein
MRKVALQFTEIDEAFELVSEVGTCTTWIVNTVDDVVKFERLADNVIV